MDTTDYYRTLGLRSGASLEAVKASYRKLARQYHPDVNQNNPQAQERFIALTEAYKFLLDVAKPESEMAWATASYTQFHQGTTTHFPRVKTKVYHPENRIQFNQELSETEQKLKENCYKQLQQLLRYQRFPRAIALVEGLAHRIPQDQEIRQWQAITYQRWARQLIKERQTDKARNYLKKALRTDPHNRTLWAEVERDFQSLESVYS
ncbi:DnaJ domain-containing protein [Arthrospira platensis]|jgi:curved DNA-binding protein CbpA|uniref:DnaJ domain protein n=1 Tax=Limnospira platensis NIES-46 TaxID=1236695 RepID=A0A5M3T5M2_LIMPL|nr:DnaJ domain-containing protein [Arthrospira platensis]AMW29262.1 molecular chaperone DnaJ [Arthrospira platensis YZ]MBD2671521.1 J domain-containing protein [Arthrospira platensis FACHB-439]MBD2712392.1 J domain-containing protein [Arthrospira platensis FACHB-835]MDF2213141.1 DnaJ domain-containing protein [Arthrospira platensis NCB002]MDT9185467.1 DnaJ domain-containing protein [Limnospira sp. PMC 289.06]MDT9297633.1 DnaJ domain-containing protein [Arthrospira platensis PCC 7345]QQW27130